MFLLQKSKIIFFGLIMVLLFLAPARMVLAADLYGPPLPPTGADKALGGLDTTANKGGLKTSGTETDLPAIIGKVVGAILAFVGVIFFCLILWAGFGWMLAQGNEEKINEAKQTIFGAVLGLLVILGAYAITNLIASIFSAL